MGVLRMGYVHARVTDLEDAKQHYGSTMGLYETRSEPGRVFYKGWDEWDHHSVVLEEGGVGLAKIGYKVADPGDIEIYEKRAEQFGCTVQRMVAGENPEVSDGIRITLPSQHELELFHDMTLVGTEVGHINPEVFPRHLIGVGAPRVEHALLATDDVKLADRFFCEVLDFYAERSPIFLAAVFDADAAAARGQAVGDGTPVHVTIPTDNPWVPLRILALGKHDAPGRLFCRLDDAFQRFHQACPR